MKETKDILCVSETDRELSLIELEEVYYQELKQYFYELVQLKAKHEKLKEGTVDVKTHTLFMDELHALKQYQKILQDNRNALITTLSEIQNTPKKVFYMQHFLGLSLREIADELMLDYGYVRKVASKANKEYRAKIEEGNK